jgi:hypothetical protein
MRTTILVGMTIGLLALGATPLYAQATGDKAAAEALFREAGKLFQAGKYAEACPKLAASQKLDPAVGTLMNLGHCYERTGQTASAWATYSEAADAARAAGQADREKSARKAADAVEKLLSRLTISAPKEQGAEIRRDGTAVPNVSWGLPTPVDPGEHVIEVSAPGKKAWTTKVTVEAKQATSVDIPALEALPVVAVAPAATAAPPTTESAPPTPASSGRRTAGLVIAGVGVVGIGIGSVFGLGAMSSKKDADAYCNAQSQCSPQGGSARDSAKSKATMSTAFFGVGIAALAAGTVVLLTAPKNTEAPKTTAWLGLGIAPPIGACPAAVTYQ